MSSFFGKIINKHLSIIPIFLGLALSPILFFGVTSASNLSVTVSVITCGDNIKAGGEQCDGTDLGGATCISQGYSSGNLSCESNCTFNVSGCVSGGGGTGGGGGTSISNIETKVILEGRAYPSSTVTILKDGKEAGKTIADNQANFQKEITNLSPGVYTFSLWAEDKNKIKSITYTLTFRVSANAITNVSGIFLPSTIDIDKTTVKKGEILNIFGQTIPEAEVNIYIASNEIIEKVYSDKIGAWILPFFTQRLEDGMHTAKARSKLNSQEASGFSNMLAFVVGDAMRGFFGASADVNKDKKVNLTDFSILLYNWGSLKNKAADLNHDGKINIVDFSIMLYWWTG